MYIFVCIYTLYIKLWHDMYIARIPLTKTQARTNSDQIPPTNPYSPPPKTYTHRTHYSYRRSWSLLPGHNHYQVYTCYKYILWFYVWFMAVGGSRAAQQSMADFCGIRGIWLLSFWSCVDVVGERNDMEIMLFLSTDIYTMEGRRRAHHFKAKC